MSEKPRKRVVPILKSLSDGNSQAADKLLPLVYDELRVLARARLRGRLSGQTLQPTALVHEAYLRLVGDEDPGWHGRGHFYAAAARAMRQILVEQARCKTATKRGGNRRRVPTGECEPAVEPLPEEILAIDEAIKRLECEDPRKGKIVNLRYFARMTVAETAAALDISAGTVVREWRYIRTWLEAELTSEN
ncbi:MAG: hypothetical protein JSU63_21790 [Phycisphaerales bacterium]|nr:MAG: hypothetical protein JSU63_21790 [Phycisphaerales bacterium]